MRLFDAATIRERLPWPRVIDALAQALRAEVQAPLRSNHPIEVPGEPSATQLLMPAWRIGERLGVKLVTVFPGNATRGSRRLRPCTRCSMRATVGQWRLWMAMKSPHAAQPVHQHLPRVT